VLQELEQLSRDQSIEGILRRQEIVIVDAAKLDRGPARRDRRSY
jgi:hypothetical protein